MIKKIAEWACMWYTRCSIFDCCQRLRCENHLEKFKELWLKYDHGESYICEERETQEDHNCIFCFET